MMGRLDYHDKEAYEGTYTADGLTYDCYRVTYCEKPVTGLMWSGEHSEDFFRMNIKVPLGLSEEQKKKAQILYYNPWGGDYGQTVPPADTLDNPMKTAVLKAGWILIEPGMRGTNCYTGTPGEADYCHHAKLPRPLADLKAGIRYLRYDHNAELIPGDKERIWIAGVSSGGCASSIIGTSGDSDLFRPYLEEIGAADTSDAVYGAAPSCPVMNRGNLDAALAWERWHDRNMEDADPLNRALTAYYADYFNSLGLIAEKDVPEGGIRKGDLLTDANMSDYSWSYVREAGMKFFGRLTAGEIKVYLNSKKPADPMYGTPEMSRNWIRPVFDAEGKITDFKGSYDDFWRYTAGDARYDEKEMINWQCDHALAAPDEVYEGNGILNIGIGTGYGARWSMPSTPSFGKPSDIGAVFSEFGLNWLKEQRGMTITDEYDRLIALQRNSVNPMYFLLDRKGDSKVAAKWFLRTGTVDQVTPHPNFLALGVALMNAGCSVDIAFVWDEVHGLTSEIPEFMDFAEDNCIK